MAEPDRLQQAALAATGMPGTIRDNAGTAVSRAVEQWAEAQAAMRGAVSALKDAFDLLHGTMITPGQARSLVTVNARHGPVGSIYLDDEESQFSAYDLAFQPAGWSRAAVAAELKRLRALSEMSCAELGRALGVSRATVSNIELGKTRVSEARVLAWEQAARNAAGKVPPAGVSDVAAQALAAAGRQLAQAEIACDEALNRLVDAADFAVHAGLSPDDVDDLLPAVPDPDGSLSTAFWAAGDAARRTAVPVPAGFRDLDLRARAAKLTGDHENAAATWTAARSLLPDGHDLRAELDGMINSLHTAARTGQYVSPDGHLLPLLEAAVIVGTAEAVQAPQESPGPPAVRSPLDFPDGLSSPDLTNAATRSPAGARRTATQRRQPTRAMTT
jgi:transcriptional regulator with XRE-family HTH domain